MSNIIQFFLTIIILLFNISAYGGYGGSCAPVQIPSDDENYFTTSTAYSMLKDNIDNEDNVPGGCAQEPGKIAFCIRGKNADPCDLVTMSAGDQKLISNISKNPDIGGNNFLGPIILTAQMNDNKLCVNMPTSRGKVSLICRQAASNITTNVDQERVCRPISEICYREDRYSQSLLSISGSTVHCLKESLKLIFFERHGCNYGPDDNLYVISHFADFQQALRGIITVAMTIYVIIFGINTALTHGYLNLNNTVSSILKLLLVTYFSIGFSDVSFDSSNKAYGNNGMVDFALPLLTGMTSEFSQMVYNAGGSRGLCTFNKDKYRAGYEYYALWDSIDCRVGYYFGMKILYDLTSLISNENSDTDDLGFASNKSVPIEEPKTYVMNALKDAGAFSYFIALFGFFMFGNVIIVICSILFAIIFTSMVFYFLSVYLVCIITLHGMCYIAPIFVPMALFNRTKGYFDAWLRIIVSCTLQPAIVGGFIAFMLSFFDTAMYGNCEFKRHDYEIIGKQFSTFELREPTNEPEKCTSSVGYSLLHNYHGSGWETSSLLLFESPALRDLKNLTLGFVKLLIFSGLMYVMMGFISSFASELTSGVSTAGVTVSPQEVVNLAIKTFNAVKDGAASAQNLANEFNGNKDAKGGGGEEGLKEAEDMLSGGGEGGGGEGGGKGDGAKGEGGGGSGGGAGDAIAALGDKK